ncbi:MAG: winged helix-turn-helix domain-containing protein [Vicinamibacterales bacterium]
MSSTAPGTRVRFGAFVFDERTLELSRDGVSIRLQHQPARVLARLVARAGDLVTREELRQAIWGEETFVDFDRGLNYAIGQIRIALEETADAPRHVETLRGLGYRFAGTVTRDVGAPREDVATPEAIVTGREAGARAGQPASSTPHVGRWWSRRRARLAAAALATAALAVVAGTSLRAPIQRQRQVSPLRVAVPPFTIEGTDGADPARAEALHAKVLVYLAQSGPLTVIDLSPEEANGTDALWRLEARIAASRGARKVFVTLRDERTGIIRWSEIFDTDSDDDLARQITAAVRMGAGLPPDTGPRLRRRARASSLP